jgi:molybdopterin molybdotransferase
VATEVVGLDRAGGRTLAETLAARRTQPPFAASAMDGYAVRAADTDTVPARLDVVGYIAAGSRLDRAIGPGEAARIFTGAPVPAGADAILIQEDTTAPDERTVIANARVTAGTYVRPAGLDFSEGARLLAAGRRLGFREIALAAAMGYGEVTVRRPARVALIATGDELVPPGATPGESQIVASTTPGLAAYVASLGGEAHDLGIVADDPGAIVAAIDRAMAIPADVLVTIGGASVGAHDLVATSLGLRGLELDFWKIAMRPGKPLLYGRIGATRVLGLPGNPVSSLVCALLFLRPLMDALLGRPQGEGTEPAILGADVPANGNRQDYMRARLERPAGTMPVATPLPVQDSSMLANLTAADCLIVRPIAAPPATAGETCTVLPLP